MKEKYFNAAPTKCVSMDYEYTLAKLGSLKKLYSNNRVMCPTKGKHEYSFQNRGRYASLPLELLGNLTTGMSISHIGNSILRIPHGSFDLNNILHVPNASKIILSHKFTLDNHVFIKFHHFFF
jgi:hypothetical protein